MCSLRSSANLTLATDKLQTFSKLLTVDLVPAAQSSDQSI